MLNVTLVERKKLKIDLTSLDRTLCGHDADAAEPVLRRASAAELRQRNSRWNVPSSGALRAVRCAQTSANCDRGRSMQD